MAGRPTSSQAKTMKGKSGVCCIAHKKKILKGLSHENNIKCKNA
jgi:hypothetical protein